MTESGLEVLKILSNAFELRISAFIKCNSQLVIPLTRSSAASCPFQRLSTTKTSWPASKSSTHV